jgi:tetratricopeptide (TPR) repeat protein
MCKWRKILNTFLFGTLLLSAAGSAQEDKLFRAQQLLKAKQSDQALVVIDSVATHPQTKEDFITWTTRAYIYFDLYKRTDRMKLVSPLRDSIVSSLNRSNSFKPDSMYARQNKSLLTNIAVGYFNLGKALLQDSVNYERSQQAYDKFRDLYLQAEPNTNMTARDVEYNLAVGSLYLDMFMKNTSNTKAGEVAKVYLLKVLDVQPDNPSALVNMGLMYYNQAAHISQSMDYDVPFETLDVVQEDMVKLAKQAEQFIVKAYNQDNKNPKAVEALFYIYRMLLDFKKSDEFKAKCKELGIDVEQSSKPTNK